MNQSVMVRMAQSVHQALSHLLAPSQSLDHLAVAQRVDPSLSPLQFEDRSAGLSFSLLQVVSRLVAQ